MALIALTTDFGLGDAYVGILKGVILGICPGAAVVDVCHGVPPQDVTAGALALEAARPYFPPGTIHVGIVDPGVGTDRRALLARTERDILLAPDNGLLSFLPGEELRDVRVIENPSVMLHPVSRTFQGRDVFAPAAAHLANGFPPEEMGPTISNFQRFSLPRLERTTTGLRGEVLAFDRFGNAVTSIRETDLPGAPAAVGVAGRRLALLSTYAAAPEGEPLALIGSSGRLEVAVRNGSARDRLGLKPGDPIEVYT